MEIVERLVRMPELDINRKGLGENSALTFAAGQGYTDIVKILLRSGPKRKKEIGDIFSF